MNQTKQTRRKFIKQSVATTSGLILAYQFPLSVFSKPASKSKVIIAHSDKVIDADGLVNPEILQELVDQSILELSGTKDLKEAWQKYFTKEDIIGFKVNANSYSALEGTPMIDHYPLITNSVLNSMQKANIPLSNAVIWERTDKELATMGYSIQKGKGALRVMGTKTENNSPEDSEYQPGFSEVVFPVGEKSTRLSNILENDITALINLPALKSHRLAGVTGALKNHYGSIDNPRDFHDDDCCNPGIAEINNISIIRDKHKLVICNALMGLWDGGPRWNRANMWMEGSLIVGVDPVAVDAVMLQLIDQKRTEAGLESVAPMTRYLQLSEEIGLGNSNRKILKSSNSLSDHMKTFKITFILFLTITFSAQAQQYLISMLPEIYDLPGLEVDGGYEIYKGDNLFDLINGGADVYLEYGFSQLIFQNYKSPDNRSFLRIEIYEFDNPASAFGIFSYSTMNTRPVEKNQAFRESGIGYEYLQKGNFFIVLTYSNISNGPNSKTIAQIISVLSDYIEEPVMPPNMYYSTKSPCSSPEMSLFFRGDMALRNLTYLGFKLPFKYQEAMAFKCEAFYYMVFIPQSTKTPQELIKETITNIITKFPQYIAESTPNGFVIKEGDSIKFDLSAEANRFVLIKYI